MRTKATAALIQEALDQWAEQILSPEVYNAEWKKLETNREKGDYLRRYIETNIGTFSAVKIDHT